MSPALIVLLLAVSAALIAFGISVSRDLPALPVDLSAVERKVRRSLWRHPKVKRFLNERFDRKSAGGFLLTASLAVLFVVAVFVGLVLDMIDNQSGLAAADRSVAAWGSRNGSSATATAMKWITQLGASAVIAAALVLTASIDFARRRSWEVFAFVAAIGVGVLLLNNLLKLIVHRERPTVLQLVTAHGYSFPSGHTASATATWLAIALLFGRDRSRVTRSVLIGGAVLIAISVAASRALLGVHWLTDVIAGFALGGGWFMIVAIIFGGRVQRLGDPITDNPQGTTPAADAGLEPVRE